MNGQLLFYEYGKYGDVPYNYNYNRGKETSMKNAEKKGMIFSKFQEH